MGLHEWKWNRWTAIGTVMLLLAVLALAFPLTAQGQSSTPEKREFRFERISLEQGLANESVHEIIQDSQGFMWFGTEDGLNRYDGFNFIVMRHDSADPNSLSSNDFGKIVLDPSGIMWLGTWGGGLNRYDPKTGTIKRYIHDAGNPHSLSNDRVEFLYKDSFGRLWVGTDGGGVNRLDRTTGNFIRYRHHPDYPASLSSDKAKAICEDNNGNIWIGTDHGLNRWDPETGDFTHYFNEPGNHLSLSRNRIRAMVRGGNGTLWIGTRGGGLNRFDPKTGTSQRYTHDPVNPGSISDNSIASLYRDSMGNLWIGTYYGGLNLFDPGTGTFTYYRNDPRNSDSLSHNRVDVIYEDRSHNLWLGTRGGGVNRIDLKPEKFQNYSFTPHESGGLPHPTILALIPGTDERYVWLGTDGEGVFLFHPEQNRNVFHIPNGPGGLSSGRIRSLLMDTNGELWVGTYSGGLDRVTFSGKNNFRVRRFKHDPNDKYSIAGNRIHDILEDSDGRIWVATSSGLSVLQFSKNLEKPRIRIKNYVAGAEHAIMEGIGGNYTAVLYQDNNGFLWIGTESGLNRLDVTSRTFTYFRHDPVCPTSLSNDDIQVIHEVPGGPGNVLWIGTEKGLNRLDTVTLDARRFFEKDGLAANKITGILSDENGNLWIATTRGLSKLDPESGAIKNYDVFDGLPGNNFHRNTSFKRQDGLMLFCSTGGITAFYPERVKDNPYHPPLAITAVKIFNRATLLTAAGYENTPLELSYKENFLSFEFVALDYSNRAKNRFAYRLEGIDPDWVDSGSRRFATYSNLAPGGYEFRVTGSNNDGVWNKEGAGFKFVIMPPFWKTWWFRLLLFLFTGGLLYGGVRFRFKQIEKRNKELKETNARLEEQVRLRKQAEEQLIHLQKLETIGTLAGGIAHDFNNILGPILGYTEMTLDELSAAGVDPAVKGWLENVVNASHRAKELVQQILLFARRGEHEFKPLLVQVIIKEAIKLIRASFSPTIEIRQEIDDKCKPVLADASQIHQVFMNLCTNAKHAMQENGGLLTVTLQNMEVDEELARLHPSLLSVNYVRLTVRDSGHGMDHITRERLFEPFYTTKNPGEGTGMGLAVVHGIVVAHGGEITVFSEPGKGSEFNVYLPIGLDELPDQDDIPEKTVVSKGNEHILLVDDEESMTLMAKSILKNMGYRVTIATNSSYALAVFNEDPHSFDLLLTDHTMPGKSGIQLTREIKQLRPDLPVILMSGFAESIDRDEVMEAGIAFFIPKPFRPRVLGARIRKVLDAS